MAGDGALPFAGSSALKAREAWGNGSRNYQRDDVKVTRKGEQDQRFTCQFGDESGNGCMPGGAARRD
jgi:hypothetical protein